MSQSVDFARIPVLLRELLNRNVTAQALPAFSVTETEPWTLASYVTDEDKAVAVIACDLELVANAGAALVLLPASASKESVTRKKLDPALLENFQEILNIYTSLFTAPGSARVRLGKVCASAKDLPPDAAALLKTPANRHAEKLTIPGYGGGRMGIFS